MRNNTFIHTAFIIVGLVSFLTVVEAKRGHRRVYDFDLLLSQSQEQQRNSVQVPASTLKSTSTSTSTSTAAYNVVELTRHLELEASTDDDDDNDGAYDYDDDDDDIDDVDDYEDVSSLSSASLSVNLDSCVPIGECQLCHGGKRSGHPGCSATGRRVKMSCKPATSASASSAVAADGDNNPKFIIVQKSCNRTSLDEEYIMVRFQGLCLFIAFFALKSVRREKIATASLFDIRKNQRIRQEIVPLSSGGGGKNGTGTISKSSHSHSNGNSNNNGNNYFGEEGAHFQSEGSEAMA
jgi:hypothetical protein